MNMSSVAKVLAVSAILVRAAVVGANITGGTSFSSVNPAVAAAVAQRAAQIAGEPAIEQVAAVAKVVAAAAGGANPEVPAEQAEKAMADAAGTAAAAVSVAPQQAAAVAMETADQISFARGEREEQQVLDSVRAAAEAAEVAASEEGLTPQQSVDAAKAAAIVAAMEAGRSAIEAQAVVEPVIAGLTEKVPAQSAQMTPDVIAPTLPPTVSPAPVIDATLPPPPTAAKVEVAVESFPVVPAVLTNIGKDCWEACDRLSGLCSFCGKGNACCRHNTTGEGSQPKECQDILTYLTWHHECVIPVHRVTPHEAAAWAASQAAAAAWMLPAQQQVSAAGDAAGETAIRAGAEAEAPEAAAASAAIVAWETAMSGQEVLDAAKAAAGKAAAEAHQSTAGVAEAVTAGVEEVAVQAGIQAAKLTKVTKVDGKSVQDQAAAAAAKEAAIAAFDMQQPAQVAEESARVSSMAVATAAGPLWQAAETADVAVKAIISSGALKPAEPGTNAALRHAFADCYGNCGNKPGMCHAFCGIGNACCRISGDIVVPPECQNIATYITGYYECVVPHQATLVGLVPVSGDNPRPAVEIQAQAVGQATTDGTPSTRAPADQGGFEGGFGIATFSMIGGGVVAFIGACMVLYAVSSPKKSVSRGVRMEVSMEESGAPSDLESDAPLIAPFGVHALSHIPQFSPSTPVFAPAAGGTHLPYQWGIRSQAGTPMQPMQAQPAQLKVFGQQFPAPDRTS